MENALEFYALCCSRSQSFTWTWRILDVPVVETVLCKHQKYSSSRIPEETNKNKNKTLTNETPHCSNEISTAENFAILGGIIKVGRNVTHKVTMEAILFIIVAKTRLDRAVEIKLNGRVQNENNSKQLKLYRIIGLVELLLEKYL